MTRSLESLPVEILGHILEQVDDQQSLRSIILSSRMIYSAYNEQKEAIQHAIWRNTFADCEIYCRFLTYAIKTFLPYRQSGNYVPGSDIIRFVTAYIYWSNPPEDETSDFIQEPLPTNQWLELTPIPEPLRHELEQTHKYIMAWTKRFCDEQLKYHGLTREATDQNVPATRSELTRICSVFYQIWIFCVCYGLKTDGLKVYLKDPEDEMPADDEIEHMNTLSNSMAEAFSFRDFTIAYISLLDFLYSSAEPVFTKIIQNDRYIKLCRDHPEEMIDLEITGQAVPIERDEAPIWSLVCRLGPIEFWKFLFESTENQQLATSLTHHPTADFSWFREFIAQHCRDDTAGDYAQILRVCVEEVNLVKAGYRWYSPFDYTDWKARNNVIMWDDWRLKKWGFRFPTIEPPLCIEGFSKMLENGTVEDYQWEEYFRKGYLRFTPLCKGYLSRNGVLDSLEKYYYNRY